MGYVHDIRIDLVNNKARYLQRKAWLPKGRQQHIADQIERIENLLDNPAPTPRVHLRDHYLFSLKDELKREAEKKAQKLIRIAS